MICDMTFRNFMVLQLNPMSIILEDLIMDVTQDMNFTTFLVNSEFSKLLIWVSYCRDFYEQKDSDDYISKMDGWTNKERLK